MEMKRSKLTCIQFLIRKYRPTLDGWELRKGINDMQGYDNFPEPKIVIAALEACRRLNEHSVAVRYLEALKVIRSNDLIFLVFLD